MKKIIEIMKKAWKTYKSELGSALAIQGQALLIAYNAHDGKTSWGIG